jgi:DNA polymerase epsilon subunit 1
LSGETENDVWTEDINANRHRNPGAYRTICVELDLHHLAVTAIAAAENMLSVGANGAAGDVGGGGGGDGMLLEGGDAVLGDAMACATSFQLLRTMVLTWLREAEQEGNTVANDLLQHCYRLVCSPSSLLYDPALHRVLHAAMERTFVELVGSMQSLGANIIYASFGKVIIATNKLDLKAGIDYVNFIVETIKTNSLFNRLSLTTGRFWHHFLFLDEDNYGGIVYSEVERPIGDAGEEMEEGRTAEGGLLEEEKNKGFEIVNGDTYEPKIVCEWSMDRYFAEEEHQNYFRAMIARFSNEPFLKEKREKLKVLKAAMKAEKENDDEGNTRRRKGGGGEGGCDG